MGTKSERRQVEERPAQGVQSRGIATLRNRTRLGGRVFACVHVQTRTGFEALYMHACSQSDGNRDPKLRSQVTFRLPPSSRTTSTTTSPVHLAKAFSKDLHKNSEPSSTQWEEGWCSVLRTAPGYVYHRHLEHWFHIDVTVICSLFVERRWGPLR